VKARKCCHDSVQQSDYIHIWQQNEAQPQVDVRPMWRAKLRSALQTSALIDFAYILHIKLSGKRSLSGRNPHLTARSVSFLAQ
jgi:predicted ATPase